MFNRKKSKSKIRQPRFTEGQDDGNTFRRSRTLTGAVSSDVSSAAEGRSSHLKSHRLKLHQLKKHRRGLVAGIAVALLVAAGLAWLVTQFIRDPQTSLYYPQKTVQQQAGTVAYGTTIEEYFVQHPLERFAFELNKERLLSFLQEKHPEVKTIGVNVAVDGTQDITMTFRKPILSWNTNDTLLFIDDSGVAFDTNYFNAPTVAVEDRTGVEFQQSEVVVSERFMGFLGRMVGNINKGKVGKVSKVIIPAGTLRQIDVQLKGKDYRIKTHIDRDPYVQAQDAINAVKRLNKQGITPEYIDVRVQGRAFYRE